MSISYFKPRDRFDFSNDTLDIGNTITWSRKDFLKHLFKRIFAISEERTEEFYHHHHLDYYLERYPNSNEEPFFRYLWELIERQLKVLSHKDVYDKDHALTRAHM